MAVICSLIAFASSRVGFYAFIATFIDRFVRPFHISYAALLSGHKWIIQLVYRNDTVILRHVPK